MQTYLGGCHRDWGFRVEKARECRSRNDVMMPFEPYRPTRATGETAPVKGSLFAPVAPWTVAQTFCRTEVRETLLLACATVVSGALWLVTLPVTR